MNRMNHSIRDPFLLLGKAGVFAVLFGWAFFGIRPMDAFADDAADQTNQIANNPWTYESYQENRRRTCDIPKSDAGGWNEWEDNRLIQLTEVPYVNLKKKEQMDEIYQKYLERIKATDTCSSVMDGFKPLDTNMIKKASCVYKATL